MSTPANTAAESLTAVGDVAITAAKAVVSRIRAARRPLPIALTYRGKKRTVFAEIRRLERDGEEIAVLDFRLQGCIRRYEIPLAPLFWTALEKDERKRRVKRAAKKKSAE